MYQTSAHYDLKQRRNCVFPYCLGNHLYKDTSKVNNFDLLYLIFITKVTGIRPMAPVQNGGPLNDF